MKRPAEPLRRQRAASGDADPSGPRGAHGRSVVAPPAGIPPKPAVFDRLADLLTACLAAVWVTRLAVMAAGARFATDECFHATMAAWIARHGRLPVVLPEFYSGFAAGYYPPLFHLIGAAAVSGFGTGALRFLNVALSALLIATLGLGGRWIGAPAAGRWAALLCVANAWISTYAVRLYVEPLTTLLVAAALILVLRVHRREETSATIGLGVTVGLLLLAKHSGLALAGLLAGLAVVFRLRGALRRAACYARATAIALLVAAPMFVRNAWLFGSPLYPAFAPDLDPYLFALNRTRFTPAPLALYAGVLEAAGVALGACVVGAVAVAAHRRRAPFAFGLLVAGMAVVLAAPLQPLLETRHLLPVIAGSAFLACVVLEELVGSWRLRAAITLGLLLSGAFFVARMPDWRKPLDVPPEQLDAFAAVAREVPPGERVLSLLTYDTFYYSRRPATWPVPWGQKDRPLEMFITTDSDSIAAAFARHRLQYVLLWRPAIGDSFDGANYPAGFVRALETRVREGRARLLWKSDWAALLSVPPPPGP